MRLINQPSGRSAEDRPFNRVLNFILKELPEEKKTPGCQLPTTRQLSKMVNVSPATVRNVYKHLADQGILSAGVGNGTFWVKPQASATRQRVIGLDDEQSIDNLKSRSWTYRVYGGLLKGIFETGNNLRLHMTELFKDGDSAADAAVKKELRALDAFILSPSLRNERIVPLLQELEVPFVSINPLQAMGTENFVSPDYYSASLSLGRAFARTGRRRILAFFSPGVEHSCSCQLRLAGFSAGLFADGRAPELRTLFAPCGTRAVAAELYRRFLGETGWKPDAVYTAGDEMAAAVYDCALESGVAVPEELSIVGGNGTLFGQPKSPSLSAMIQPLEAIGEDVINLLQQIFTTGLRHHPGRYHRMQFGHGASTRPEENAIL